MANVSSQRSSGQGTSRIAQPGIGQTESILEQLNLSSAEDFLRLSQGLGEGLLGPGGDGGDILDIIFEQLTAPTESLNVQQEFGPSDPERGLAERGDFFRSIRSGRRADVLSEDLASASLGLGTLSPDEQRLIRQQTDLALEAGVSDIDRFTQQAIEQVRGGEASARGLRPTDTPIVDRTVGLAEEGTRQKSVLSNQLRSQEAGLSLQLPFQRVATQAQVAGQEQSAAQAAAAFQASLNQAAFQNRLSLSAGGQQPLFGLLQSLPNPTQALAVQQQPRIAATGAVSQQTSSGSGQSVGVLSCSRALKKDGVPVNRAEIFAKLMAVPIEEWTYIGEDGDRHIGPYAEDLQAEFGGSLTLIEVVDLFGILMASVQELGHRVIELEKGQEEG